MMILKIFNLIDKIENKALFFYWKSIVPKLLQECGVELPNTCILYGSPIIQRHEESTIEIGDSVVLCSLSKYTDLAVNHPVVIRTIRANAHISIGKNTGISGATISCAERISIGENCLLGANVTIVDTDFHPISPANRRSSRVGIKTAPVSIGDNVFIGANTLILKGVTVGENSIIGAGSVVTRSIPKNTIAGGNPAKKIGEL